MNDEALVEMVEQALFDVAPDLAGEEIEPDVTFANQFEIDSMDYLGFLIALHRATGLEIPQRDYPQLTTLSGCVAYLKTHLDEDKHVVEGEHADGE